MAFYLDKRVTNCPTWHSQQLAKQLLRGPQPALQPRYVFGMAKLATGTATLRRPATTFSPRHKSGHCWGHLGGKKSLFLRIFAKQSDTLPPAGCHRSQAATAPQPPSQPASDTFATHRALRQGFGAVILSYDESECQ
jgi:hypothetical protein